MNRLVVALDVVPDVAGLRLLNKLPAELSDSEVAEYAFQRRRALSGFDGLPPHLQKLAGFACVSRTDNGFTLHSQAGAHERVVLTEFWSCCEGFFPERWSELEASLAALSFRSLQLGLRAPCLSWPDPLAMRLAGEGGELPALASVSGLSGLPQIEGANEELAWRSVLTCDWAGLRAQAELRALSACILDLRFRFMTGQLSLAVCRLEEEALRECLLRSGAAHLQAFEAGWRAVY